MKTELKLCYVDGDWAYFTSKELSEQWGDDWNDAPYEHNAEAPYADGAEIVKVAFDGAWERPCDSHHNSPYSVEQINAGAIAWLRSSSWTGRSVIILAGTTLERFKDLINEGGGKTYEATP